MHTELLKLEKIFKPSVLTKIDDPRLVQYGVELWLKRDDLLHPVISGNKWRKLKYSLNHALTLKADTLISMGGAYSNHLHALAYTAKCLGLKSIGIIRGEESRVLNPCLSDMKNWGMRLQFITRSDYRLLRQYKGHQDLPNILPNQYWLPEGGAQCLALKGVAELVTEIPVDYDVLCTPCGTGTTLAGLISAASENVTVTGFAALKNAGFLTADVQTLLAAQHKNWHINPDYHFGGFAKTSPELLHFIAEFKACTHITLEPVYTGKMMYALYDLLSKNAFKSGQRIIALHTGGLQGNRGFAL